MSHLHNKSQSGACACPFTLHFNDINLDHSIPLHFDHVQVLKIQALLEQLHCLHIYLKWMLSCLRPPFLT